MVAETSIKFRKNVGYIKWAHFRFCFSILKVSQRKKIAHKAELQKGIIYRLVLIDSQDFSKQYLMTKEEPGISLKKKHSLYQLSSFSCKLYSLARSALTYIYLKVLSSARSGCF